MSHRRFLLPSICVPRLVHRRARFGCSRFVLGRRFVVTVLGVAARESACFLLDLTCDSSPISVRTGRSSVLRSSSSVSSWALSASLKPFFLIRASGCSGLRRGNPPAPAGALHHVSYIRFWILWFVLEGSRCRSREVRTFAGGLTLRPIIHQLVIRSSWCSGLLAGFRRLPRVLCTASYLIFGSFGSYWKALGVGRGMSAPSSGVLPCVPWSTTL